MFRCVRSIVLLVGWILFLVFGLIGLSCSAVVVFDEILDLTASQFERLGTEIWIHFSILLLLDRLASVSRVLLGLTGFSCSVIVCCLG
ncbi:hypothetical protein OPV22_034242 [Ensete ventricosum]|uniref:Uncharacterized protein n=1 Tax=Ensete ventricosum TaxID=4639 RepID=A0AAV8P440_ENSVE|nr:hypothetical protein OPV22_034242 [Ensete ventricosum]